jgi:kumamolisin
MADSKNRVVVPGSEKKALPGAKVLGKLDPSERIEITVVVRSRREGLQAGRVAASARDTSTQLPEARQYLSRESFATERGADPEDVDKVEAFAKEHNLTVVEASLPKRSIRLAGTIKNLTAAFQPNLKKSKIGSRVVRMRTGGISVPTELSEIVVAVMGFDDRPAASPHVRFLSEPSAKKNRKLPASKGGNISNAKVLGGKKAKPHANSHSSFKPPEVARLYNFPANLQGDGQCVAIIELNDFDDQHNPTGTGFSLSDLKTYFSSLGLPTPKVTAIGVASNGGTGANVPGSDPNSDGEVMLDIEVAGAVAPKASLAVYFALNTDDGFLAAFNAALHDNVRKPSVISISWGSSEDSNTQQALTAFNQALQDAAAMGVSVCCSAGDDGSSDIRKPADRDGQPHVDFPASSPFALACGGTNLVASGANITRETVWNDGRGATGGGVSNHFPRPAYQSKSNVPLSPNGKVGRGVPDVAGDADPNTGYEVRLVGGKTEVIGGTSAVAPLWAGLIALLNEGLSKVSKPPAGLLNPILYQLPTSSGVFHDIVEGNNDIEGLNKYAAGPAWDPCTGLGTPDGKQLLTALGA